VSLGQAGATITSPKANIGTRMQGTALCRATGVGAQVQGAMAFGTRGRDTLRSRSFNAIAWGGPGGDRIGLTGAGAVAWGGQGRDRIVVSGKDSVAAGGPGPDRLVARGANRILLKGGPGPDTLVGGTGPTYINAADGKGGDRVLCRTSQTRAIVDADDRVVGPCTIVTPTR
jgi:Ca2+-binding RTX toxin-like protein